MTVKLMKPFQGRYYQGDIVTFDKETEEHLIRQGAAVRVSVSRGEDAKTRAKREKAEMEAAKKKEIENAGDQSPRNHEVRDTGPLGTFSASGEDRDRLKDERPHDPDAVAPGAKGDVGPSESGPAGGPQEPSGAKGRGAKITAP